MPRLTEYLLKLATDAKELQRYRDLSCKDETLSPIIAYLTDQPWPGLTESQAEALTGDDPTLLLEAVADELTRESSTPDTPLYGIGITFAVENHVHINMLLE